MVFKLRCVHAHDFHFLAHTLRAEDRQELLASHPHQPVEKLLRQFCKQSVWCVTLASAHEVAAMGGITAQGCVWLLTGKAVKKCPKTFFKCARFVVQTGLFCFPVLYNWVDGRYGAAHHLITHLGGLFDGSFIFQKNIAFLFFTFRRSFMGGVTNQSAVKKVSTALKMLETQKQNRQTYSALAQDASRDLQALEEAYEHQSNYLFRSSAEKNRALFEQARLNLSARRAAQAAKGLDERSATEQLIQQKEQWQTHAEHAKLEAQTQEDLAQKEKEKESKISLLRQKIYALKKIANQKGSLWKWGQQIRSWF